MSEMQTINKPSFFAHAFNGILMFLAIFIAIWNYDKFIRLDFATLLGLILLFSIAIGLHGLSHLFHDVYYQANPFMNLFGRSTSNTSQPSIMTRPIKSAILRKPYSQQKKSVRFNLPPLAT